MTAEEIRAQLVELKPENLEKLLVKVMLGSIIEIAAQLAEQNEKLAEQNESIHRIANALDELARKSWREPNA